MFLKNKNIIFTIRRSKVTDYAALKEKKAEQFSKIPCLICLIFLLQRLVNVYRGSYMSAHVLFILLNELGKRDKMRGLPSILSLFRNEINKFNKTRARMLDSNHHMTLRIL